MGFASPLRSPGPPPPNGLGRLKLQSTEALCSGNREGLRASGMTIFVLLMLLPLKAAGAVFSIISVSIARDYLSIYLSIRLSIYLSIYLNVHIYIHT
jgi:hypothetical protein